jgi:hypothetical protein
MVRFYEIEGTSAARLDRGAASPCDPAKIYEAENVPGNTARSTVALSVTSL